MVPVTSSNFSAESLFILYNMFTNFFCRTNCYFICIKKLPLHSIYLSFLPGKQMESEMERSRHVYIGDWLTNSWTEVNPLNVPRFGHACGKFTLFNGTEVVLVAGGQTGNKMASEIRRLEMYNFQVNCSNNFESYKAWVLQKMSVLLIRKAWKS